jgi:ABC-type uncharacterized transport system auxiliary subunit
MSAPLPGPARRVGPPLGLALAALAAAAPLGGAGCLSKSPPEPTRYFRVLDPDDDDIAARGEVPSSTARIHRGAPVPLRLRRVTAAAHLKERVAVRVGDLEMGFDDLLRWVEPPAVFVERRIARKLFEDLGLQRVEGGGSAKLDVEVRSFEEVRVPRRAAVVELWVSLVDARDRSLVERRVVGRREFDGDDPRLLAMAMGAALEDAAGKAAALIIPAAEREATR